MNWVLILVLLMLVFSVIEGYRKGFLRIIYSLVAWIIVLVLVAWAAPYINHYLLENTSIYESVEAHCVEAVRQSAKEEAQTALEGQKSELSELGVKVPDSVMNGILEKTSGAADEFLEESGMYEQIAQGLAGFVVEGISFVAALIFAWILVHIISQVLGIVSHIPIIKGINRLLGLFAGGIKGLLLVWLGFYIVALCSTGETGSTLIAYIYENQFLTFLYENNLVLTMILKYF